MQGHVDTAFSLAAGAVTELRKDPLNAEIEHVFELLFGRKPADRIPALKLVESKCSMGSEASILIRAFRQT